MAAVIYVLEASSLLRFAERSEGSARVEEILEFAMHGRSNVLISAVNWGEVAYVANTLLGSVTAQKLLSSLLLFNLSVVPVTQIRAERAAAIKRSRRLAYADCFAVELASDSSDHLLVTADLDMKSAEGDIKIEFLPTKNRT